MTRYLSIAEYFWLAEQVTGIRAEELSRSARVELADSALHAPQASYGGTDFYSDLVARLVPPAAPDDEHLSHLIASGVLRAGNGDAADVLDEPPLVVPAGLADALAAERQDRV